MKKTCNKDKKERRVMINYKNRGGQLSGTCCICKKDIEKLFTLFTKNAVHYLQRMQLELSIYTVYIINNCTILSLEIMLHDYS